MEPANTTEFILYQPNPTKQMLLHDMATSSSVFMFLKMQNFRTTIKNFTNTEFMSENGRIPVVIERDNDQPMCGFREVFWHISRQSNETPSLLEIAYLDWIEAKFLQAEMYICWCHEHIVSDYTKARYTYDLPWPVSTILFNRKRNQIKRTLGKRFADFDDFVAKFGQFLAQLEKLVANRTNPKSVNAMIYGHVYTIMSTKLHPKLTGVIVKQRRITNLIHDIERTYLS